MKFLGRCMFLVVFNVWVLTLGRYVDLDLLVVGFLVPSTVAINKGLNAN